MATPSCQKSMLKRKQIGDSRVKDEERRGRRERKKPAETLENREQKSWVVNCHNTAMHFSSEL